MGLTVGDFPLRKFFEPDGIGLVTRYSDGTVDQSFNVPTFFGVAQTPDGGGGVNIPAVPRPDSTIPTETA
jgi:hypothetical protein